MYLCSFVNFIVLLLVTTGLLSVTLATSTKKSMQLLLRFWG